jgi:hypothetical protein
LDLYGPFASGEPVAATARNCHNLLRHDPAIFSQEPATKMTMILYPKSIILHLKTRGVIAKNEHDLIEIGWIYWDCRW